jgi:hypothetical protein
LTLTHPREIHQVQQDGRILAYGYEHSVRIEPIGRFLDLEVKSHVRNSQCKYKMFNNFLRVFVIVAWKTNANLNLTKGSTRKVNVLKPVYQSLHLINVIAPLSTLLVRIFL